MPLKSVLSIDLNESDDQIKLKEKSGRARSIRLGKFRNRNRGFLLSDGNVYPLVVAKAGKDSQSYTIVHSSKAEKKKYQELFNNPSKANYVKLTNEITGMSEAFASQLYDFANNPKLKKITAQRPVAGKVFSLGSLKPAQLRPFKMPGAKELKGKSPNVKRVIDPIPASAPDSAGGPDKPAQTDPADAGAGPAFDKVIQELADKINLDLKIPEDTISIDIKGKKLYVDELAQGEFGYVLGDTLWPMFKMDIIPSSGDAWEFVESRMLPQEQNLFKMMAEYESLRDKFYTYLAYYESSDYNIPRDVILKSLKSANSEAVKKTIQYIKERGRLGAGVLFPDEGYNISKYEMDNSIRENFLAFVDSFQDFSKADTKKYEEAKAEEMQKQRLAEESFEQYSKTPREINQYMLGVLKQASKEMKAKRKLGGTAPPSPQSAGEGVGESKAPDPAVDLSTSQPAQPPGQPVQPPAPQAPPAGPPQPNVQPPQANVIPPGPPPPPPASQSGPQPDEMARGEQLRAYELDQAQQQEEEKEEEKSDNIPDISKYGHKLAVQNIFKKHNKDFSFFKKLISNDRKLKPNENKAIRKKRIDIILAEYDTLFPLPEGLQSDYDLEECLEIITFEYCYKENIRFDKAWKRQIQKLNIVSAPGEQGTAGMSQGLIVNMANLGLNVGQVINQGQAPQVGGQAQAQAGQAQQPLVPAQALGSRQTNLIGRKSARGRLKELGEDYKEIAVPLTEKPKSTKKRKNTIRQLDRPVQLKTRKKQIKTRLFSNLNHQPSQQNIRPTGELPKIRMKTIKNKKNRFKF